MSEYDSILKEQKKEEPIPEPKKEKKFPWLKIDLLLIVLLLIISYIIYYNTILSPNNILITDITRVLEKYQTINSAISLPKNNKDYYAEGTINIDNFNYNYGIIRNNNDLKFELSNSTSNLNYYIKDKEHYSNLSPLEENYIKLSNTTNLNIIDKVKENFLKYITKDKYVKKIYMNGTIPIVESNLELKNKDIEKILETSLKEKYEILLSFKNNALTNQIITMKITLTNKDNNQRWVLIFEDEELFISDGENINLKLKLTKKDKDFQLQIFQNATLYSILTGEKKENNYQYTYQIIDKIYNLTLEVKETNDTYEYLFTSSIETNNKTITKNALLTLKYQNSLILDEPMLNKAIAYNKLTKEEQETYQTSLNNLINPLREFIKEYQESINNIDKTQENS